LCHEHARKPSLLDRLERAGLNAGTGGAEAADVPQGGAHGLLF
jgi:hypothetical protein